MFEIDFGAAGKGLSKEHLFPEWLAPYIARGDATNALSYQLVGLGGVVLTGTSQTRPPSSGWSAPSCSNRTTSGPSSGRAT